MVFNLAMSILTVRSQCFSTAVWFIVILLWLIGSNWFLSPIINHMQQTDKFIYIEHALLTLQLNSIRSNKDHQHVALSFLIYYLHIQLIGPWPIFFPILKPLLNLPHIYAFHVLLVIQNISNLTILTVAFLVLKCIFTLISPQANIAKRPSRKGLFPYLTFFEKVKKHSLDILFYLFNLHVIWRTCTFCTRTCSTKFMTKYSCLFACIRLQI